MGQKAQTVTTSILYSQLKQNIKIASR